MGTVNVTFGYFGTRRRINFAPGVIDKTSAEEISTNPSSAVLSSGSAPPDIGLELTIRVLADQDTYYEVGPSPTANKTTCTRLRSGLVEFIPCRPGDKISLIER